MIDEIVVSPKLVTNLLFILALLITANNGLKSLLENMIINNYFGLIISTGGVKYIISTGGVNYIISTGGVNYIISTGGVNYIISE